MSWKKICYVDVTTKAWKIQHIMWVCTINTYDEILHYY
jgi:hypothetical protein